MMFPWAIDDASRRIAGIGFKWVVEVTTELVFFPQDWKLFI